MSSWSIGKPSLLVRWNKLDKLSKRPNLFMSRIFTLFLSEVFSCCILGLFSITSPVRKKVRFFIHSLLRFSPSEPTYIHRELTGDAESESPLISLCIRRMKGLPSLFLFLSLSLLCGVCDQQADDVSKLLAFLIL